MEAVVIIVVGDEGAQFGIELGCESVDEDIDAFARDVVSRCCAGEVEGGGGGGENEKRESGTEKVHVGSGRLRSSKSEATVQETNSVSASWWKESRLEKASRLVYR